MDVFQLRNDLVRAFVNQCPDLYKQMAEADHNSSTTISSWHTEGSVWTHTMMVMTCLAYNILNDKNLSKEEIRTLMLVGLLHDVGKPAALVEEDGKHRFKGHEGLSTYLSISVLNKFKSVFDWLSDQQIKDVLVLISLHGVNADEGDSYYTRLRTIFTLSDNYGAIREDIDADWPSRSFASQGKPTSKHLIVMVGLPCAGKSTYVESLRSDGYYVLSRDAELLKQDPSMTYREAYRAFSRTKEFNNYYQKLMHSATKQEKVVVDMTMMYKNSRKTLLNVFKDFQKSAVVLLTSNETTTQRNEARKHEGKYISKYVLKEMQKSFVHPTPSEGFSDIKTIVTY